jgi:predicted NBD/HSP70 family sugar kinase
MNFDGGMAYFQHHDNTQLSPDSFVELIKAGYQNICRERGRPAIGGGVAMSGVVQNGKVVRSLQVGPWSQVELQTILHDAFDIPMVVENDSRCASFALYWFESQIFTRPKSILALTLSQGISCSICFAGQPVEGRNGAAGEVGHIPIATNGKVCHCGKKDCLETYCNNAEVLQQVNQILQGTKAITSVSQIKEQMMIFPSIATVIDNLAQNLCKVMMPIVASLDVDNLVLISEDVEYSKLTAKALNRHFDLQLIGHEAHGIEWEPKGSLSEHRVKGAGAFAIRQAFLSAGQNIPKS